MEIIPVIFVVSFIAFFVFVMLDWEVLVFLSMVLCLSAILALLCYNLSSNSIKGVNNEEIAAFKEQGYSFYNKDGRLYAVKNQVFDLGPSTNAVKEIKVEN